MTALDEVRAHLDSHHGIGEKLADELVARLYVEAGQPPMSEGGPDLPGEYFIRCKELFYPGKIKVVRVAHVDSTVDQSLGVVMADPAKRRPWKLTAPHFRRAEWARIDSGN